MEEYQILVDEHQIDIHIKYISSSHCVTAKKLFLELGNSSRSITWKEYCCMRDNLFVVIAELHQSKFQEGYHMLHVNKHKTMYKYGPAVILTPTEFEWLNTYVEKNALRSPSDENVFITWIRKKTEAGAVSR